jgi:type III secretion system FlhB-like substrate exporter
VPFTGDWPFAAALLASVAALGSLGTASLSAWRELAQAALSGQRTLAVSGHALPRLGSALIALIGAPCAAALLLLLLQRAPSLRLLRSDADPRAPRRRPPAYGLRLQAAVTTFKWSAMACALGALLWDSLPGLLSAHERTPDELLSLAGRVLQALCLRAVWVLLALGALDLLVQQSARLRRLRMTRRELLDEQRELVGDPFMLAERRARALQQPDELLTPQLYAAKLAQLSAASLVLTGDGRALALYYAPERATAPVLWLKAEGAQALELVARAYALGVPLASDSLLADDLFRLAPMQAIPGSAHARVAQLMAAEGGAR